MQSCWHQSALKKITWVLAFLSVSVFAQESDRRFKILQPTDMTEAQQALVKSISAGPRASVAGSAANSSTGSLGSPFNVFLRSPELGEPLQQVGSYIRFKSSLGPRLTEFAILIVARDWTAQYEWHAHHRLALQAGLSADVAADLARKERPKTMQADETLVYNFCTELLQQRRVGDATYAAAVSAFGERGVMDLIGVTGYYTLVAMVLNVDRTPIPNGAKPPLE
jgi:4-carboxymuconolactone decarboxylase